MNVGSFLCDRLAACPGCVPPLNLKSAGIGSMFPTTLIKCVYGWICLQHTQMYSLFVEFTSSPYKYPLDIVQDCVCLCVSSHVLCVWIDYFVRQLFIILLNHHLFFFFSLEHEQVVNNENISD